MNNLKELLNRLEKTELPKHVGVILDGNRRWAKERGLASAEGHLAGYKALKNLIFFIVETDIKYVSIFALSVDNIKKREKDEVTNLLTLLGMGLEELSKEPIIKEKKVRIKISGRKSLFSEDFQKKIKEIESITSKNKGPVFNFCIGYDGQAELVDAVKSIVSSGIKTGTIDEKTIKENLYAPEMPAVDYIIRTGMDDGMRISGFMLWDSSYAEFKFRNTYWPDYSPKMFTEDIEEYAKRIRRMGK